MIHKTKIFSVNAWMFNAQEKQQCWVISQHGGKAWKA